MSGFLFLFFNRVKYRENVRMLIARHGQRGFHEETKKKRGGVSESANFTNLPKTYSFKKAVNHKIIIYCLADIKLVREKGKSTYIGSYSTLSDEQDGLVFSYYPRLQSHCLGVRFYPCHFLGGKLHLCAECSHL